MCYATFTELFGSLYHVMGTVCTENLFSTILQECALSYIGVDSMFVYLGEKITESCI